jgi:aminoglycoside phosphotransferase (APT) family kinase protein
MERQPMTIDAASVAHVLRQEGVDGRVEPLAAGQFTSAFVVGDVLVVRFPRHEQGIVQLRREVAVGRALAGAAATSPVLTPVHTIVRLDASPGAAFAAHPLIPGQVLDRAAVDRLGDDERSRVAADLAAFLRALHRLAPASVPAEVPVRSLPELGDDLLRRARTLLFARLAQPDRAGVEKTLLRLADHADHADRADRAAPMLCHADLGGNVLYDDATGRVGVIDFGMTTVTDPAVEAASLRAGLGATMLDAIAGSHPVLVADRSAIDAVQATFAIQDALWSAEQGDWPAVDDVLAGLAATSLEG